MNDFWGAAFSSATDDWSTPVDFFREMDREFGFTLDVCASAENAKVSRFYTREEDGLLQPWDGVCWLNPPYGETIGQWIERAYYAALDGVTVVCLVPARTDTAWWHDWAMKATEIRYLRGRLKFGGGKNSAPFPSAVLVFRPTIDALDPRSHAQRHIKGTLERK